MTIILWLLLLTTWVQGQHTHVTTGEVTGSEFSRGHVTTQEAEVPDPNTRADLPEGGATTPSRKHALSPANQRATTSATLAQFSSTVGTRSTTHLQHESRSSQTTGATSQSTNPTTTTSSPSPELSSSTQDLGTGRTSQWTSVSTHLISTASPSTTLNDKSTSTSSTRSYTTKTLFTHITRAKRRLDPPEDKSTVGGYHGKVVAWIIGGALVLMMVGFLAIFIKKRKIQKQQISTTDWAGPSPFLEGGANNAPELLRSSNRISLSSFLPQRLSKRLSLLPETDEELEDMTPGTTFGDKHRANTCGPQLEAAAPQVKGTGDLLPTETSPEAVDPPEGTTAAPTEPTGQSVDN